MVPVSHRAGATLLSGGRGVWVAEVGAKRGAPGEGPAASVTSAANFDARNSAPMEFPRSVGRFRCAGVVAGALEKLWKRLQRVAVGLAGADAQGVIDRRHEDFSVADLAGARIGGDDLDRLVGEGGGDRDFEFWLG